MVKFNDGYGMSIPLVGLGLSKVGDGAARVYTVFAHALVADGLRTARSSEVTLSATLFHHVAATYDGVQVKVYFDGVEVGVSTAGVASQFTSVNPDFPLMIGKYFVGAIGEVAMLKTARSPEAAANPLDRLCPTGAGGVPSTDVIAVFPFDEAPIAATSTVSRNAAHTGIVGYLCEQNATSFTLACPADQTIAEVTFANYGGTAGSCTGYVAATGCQQDVTAKMVELCVGQQSCDLADFGTTFGGIKTCGGDTVTLTAAARCQPTAGQSAMWLQVDAPSVVGLFSPATTLAGATAAVDAAAATAVAGSTLGFAVPALDACGAPAALWDAARHMVGPPTICSKCPSTHFKSSVPQSDDTL